MKKILFPILALVLAIGLVLPMATPVFAATTSVVSDTSVQIVGVYNKAGGVSTYVDLSGSPLNAVRAQEPKPYPTGYVTEPPEVTGLVWDTGTGNYFAATAADWIWETERAEWAANYSGPLAALYDADASRYGRVVVFQKTFNVPGIPQSGMLHITADNCVEVWINGVYLNRSATAKVAGWELADLHEASVATNGWQTVNHWAVPAANLALGANTITILAGNEYYWTDDSTPNSPVPPYVASPYRQQNPGALIFKLDVEYEEFVPAPDLEITKSADKAWVMHGDSIVYTYEVENTGNVDLDPPTVVDNDLPVTPTAVVDGHPYNIGDTLDDNVFGVNEVWEFTASYPVPAHTQGEADPIVDTATATAEYQSTLYSDESNEVSVDIVHPSIEITKDADVDFVHHSDSITYTYEVENTGDVDLDLDKTTGVVDNDLSVTIAYVSGDGGVADVLEVGETWVFSATYPVPTHDAGEDNPIVDTATATAYLETTPITDNSNQVSVDILHPDLEVTKTGPAYEGYYNGTKVTFNYNVENTGDCDLFDVSLVDDYRTPLDTSDDVPITLSGLTDLDADTFADDLAQGATATGSAQFTLAATSPETLRENIATGEGTDEGGMTVYDNDNWGLWVFSWNTRTIGYWGNWRNHYTNTQIMALLGAARSNSTNISTLTTGWSSGQQIRDYLLGQPPRSMTSINKARFLMEKQYLAAWFNVKSYMDWDDDIYIPGFTGTANTAMNPDAFVYLFTDAEKTLFGNPAGGKITVIDLLTYINTNKGGWIATQLSTAQKILDEMNNAENNHYLRFIAPDFDPADP
jgi:uncharacterized repeat protein (TIGR01451 family)